MTGLASIIASPIISTVGRLLDKLIPDKDARAKAQEALEASEFQGELQLLVGQLEVNKAEAANPSVFVSGWRPFVGWVCGAGLAVKYLLFPLAVMTFAVTVPELDLTELIPILLGLAGLRTYERYSGKARTK